LLGIHKGIFQILCRILSRFRGRFVLYRFVQDLIETHLRSYTLAIQLYCQDPFKKLARPHLNARRFLKLLVPILVPLLNFLRFFRLRSNKTPNLSDLVKIYLRSFIILLLGTMQEMGTLQSKSSMCFTTS
jgi:hypothetical protein